MCLRSCRNGGFTEPANILVETVRQGSEIVGKICNNLILVNVIVNSYQCALVAIRRHLDCKTFGLSAWVQAADEQYGTKKPLARFFRLSLNVYIAMIYATRTPLFIHLKTEVSLGGLAATILS